jgi:hypothetical protein
MSARDLGLFSTVAMVSAITVFTVVNAVIGNYGWDLPLHGVYFSTGLVLMQIIRSVMDR